jgi:hypothetical protein
MAAGRDDLRLAWGWCDHVKTLKLIRLIGFEGPYRLLRLWRYAAENAPCTGRFSSVDDLETASGWLGAPGAFQQALLACGWLDADGLTLHDWVEEQPYVAKRHERLEKARASGAEGGRRSVAARRVAQGSASPTLQGSSKGTLEGVLRGPSRVVEPPLPSLPLPSEEENQTCRQEPTGEGLEKAEPEPKPLPQIALIWNEVMAGSPLAAVRVWSASRDRTLKARLAEEPDEAVWRAAMACLRESPHHIGQNERKWKATLDFLMSPGQAAKWLDAGRARLESAVAPPVDDWEDPTVKRQREWDAAALASMEASLAAGKALSPRDAERYARLKEVSA